MTKLSPKSAAAQPAVWPRVQPCRLCLHREIASSNLRRTPTSVQSMVNSDVPVVDWIRKQCSKVRLMYSYSRRGKWKSRSHNCTKLQILYSHRLISFLFSMTTMRNSVHLKPLQSFISERLSIQGNKHFEPNLVCCWKISVSNRLASS